MKKSMYCLLVVFVLGQIWDKGFAEVVDLSREWFLVNEPRNISIGNITIPTSVHSVLRSNGLIDDPLAGFNDVNFKWVIYDNWTFQKYFKIENFENLSKNSMYLEFESIDTIATVYLNSLLILFAQNQFVKYESVDIHDLLSPDGENFLQINFTSPVLHAKYMSQISTSGHIEPPECPPAVQNGECHVNFLRKQQCSFSWDWGPAFAPIGLNGGVRLNIIENFDFNFSVSVYPAQIESIDNFALDFTFRLLPLNHTFENGLINISIDEIGFQHSQQFSLESKSTFELLVNLKGEYTPFNLWWPNGHGKQTLYNLTVEINVNNISIQKWKQIGFRSVELV